MTKSSEEAVAVLSVTDREILRREHHERERRESQSKWLNKHLPEIQAGENEFDFEKRATQWVRKSLCNMTQDEIAFLVYRLYNASRNSEGMINHLQKRLAGVRKAVDDL